MQNQLKRIQEIRPPIQKHSGIRDRFLKKMTAGLLAAPSPPHPCVLYQDLCGEKEEFVVSDCSFAGADPEFPKENTNFKYRRPT